MLTGLTYSLTAHVKSLPDNLAKIHRGGLEFRTIAKSGSSTVEPGDGLRWAEGASLGSQGQGHPGWKPSFQAFMDRIHAYLPGWDVPKLDSSYLIPS